MGKTAKDATGVPQERNGDGPKAKSTEDLELDPVLFGADPTEGIVAVEFSAPDRVQIYRREGKKTLVEEAEHRPFAWATEPLPGESRELDGKNPYRFAVTFESAGAFSKAKSQYKKELFALNDLAHQHRGIGQGTAYR